MLKLQFGTVLLTKKLFENFIIFNKNSLFFIIFFIILKKWHHYFSFFAQMGTGQPGIRFPDIFFESAHQICLKLGQKLWTIALNHRMAVLCLGKFLLWPFLGQKYIVVTLYGFWLKNCLLSLYLRNCASDFDDFFSDVRYYCS